MQVPTVIALLPLSLAINSFPSHAIYILPFPHHQAHTVKIEPPPHSQLNPPLYLHSGNRTLPTKHLLHSNKQLYSPYLSAFGKSIRKASPPSNQTHHSHASRVANRSNGSTTTNLQHPPTNPPSHPVNGILPPARHAHDR